MVAQGAQDPALIVADIRVKAAAGTFRVTQHCQQEMVADAFGIDDVLCAISNAELLENYPAHQRGACCLVRGVAIDGRPLHLVCTTINPLLIMITVYEPKPPKWLTPTQRGPRT